MTCVVPRRLLPALVALLCLSSCRSPGAAGSVDGKRYVRHTASRTALGATFRLTIYAPDRTTAEAAAAAAFTRLDQVDAALNPDRPDSEVSSLNAAGEGVPVKVGDDLFAVLQHALRLAAATRGAFDVTAGPYAELWRRTAASGRAPTSAELETTRLRVGWDELRLNAIERSATLTVPGMRIDTTGIARGYAADQVFRQLRGHGCERSRVDAGTVIVVGDAPPGRPGWPVTIYAATDTGAPRSASLTSTAVAFSPNTGIPGAAVSRSQVPSLIDPVTGRSLAGGAAAAVLAPSGAVAESAAAAAAVLGPARADVLKAAAGAARVRFGGVAAPERTPRRRR